MSRYNFIKLITLFLIIVILPQFAFTQAKISPEELIGKGTPKLFGNGYKLKQEAHQAFIKMQNAAKKEGVSITVASSYRSYAHQKSIWERKFKKFTTQGLSAKNSIKKIIEYSTIPGTSRHHWGTDIDIYDASKKQSGGILQTKNYHNNGAYCKLKEWMDNNASTYGFHLVYTDNGNRKGFKYEPWHYTYKPLSSQYLKAYTTLNIAKILQKDQLSGSESFSEVFINQYTKENILDINPELL